MTKDLLREATRALREVEDLSELEAHATRARIMSGVHQTRVKRRTRLAFLLPIAATFVAASAWGAASGKAQLVWHSIELLVSGPAPATRPVSVVGRVLPAPVANPPAPTPDSTPPAVDIAAANVATTATSATAATENIAATPSSSSARPDQVSHALPAPGTKPVLLDAHSLAPQTPEERADPTLSLYRVAHTAHFVDRDPARALAAWDAYLAAAPNGTFAPEARYNRALSLVRLGRNTEAKSALTPFANGVYGTYRQSEASALLQQLGGA